MTHFTSGSLGEVKTPVNILKEFLATFNRRQKCKAAILSWLDGHHYYGQDWIRVTYETLADVLGYCRETISKHMRELIEMGLVECDRSQLFPKDTACVYQINQSKLIESLEISRCEKTDIDEQKNSQVSANNFATYISDSKFVKEQQQPAAKKDFVTLMPSSITGDLKKRCYAACSLQLASCILHLAMTSCCTAIK